MFFDFIPFPSVLLVALCEIFPFSLLFFHSYFRSISLFPSCEIINPYDKKKPFTTKKSSILQPQRPYSLNPILNNLYPFHQYNTQPPRPITFLKTIQIIITQIIHWSRLQHHKNRHQNMQKPTHTKNLPNDTPTFPKNLPEDMEKISKHIIFSDQQIIQQCAPKIIQTILLNQLEQIMSQQPQDQKIIQKPKRQKIIDLTESLTQSNITKPQNIYLDNRVQLFTPDELKNIIYRYNENITKIRNLTKKNDNINPGDELKTILRITQQTIYF